MITIGISSYNQAEFLSDAIQSALDQTFPCEIIVVDDGSTDGSLEIARGFPVKVISQVNKGMASARNTAIMNMDGSHFLPLDSDDMLVPRAVERFREIIIENDPDIIAPSFKCFGVGNETVILEKNLNLEDFRANNRLPYCSVIRKESLLEVGGYNPNPKLWGVNDYHLWVDLLKRGKKLVTIPEPLFLYRTKESSMWTEAAQHEEDWRAVLAQDHPELYADA